MDQYGRKSQSDGAQLKTIDKEVGAFHRQDEINPPENTLVANSGHKVVCFFFLVETAIKQIGGCHLVDGMYFKKYFVLL